MMRKLLIIMVLTAVALPVIGFAAFGPPDDLEFSEYASPPSAAVQEDWFGHIGVKVLLLGASLLVAVFLSKRFFTNRRLRKVYLLINVAVLGFAVGGMLCPISAIQNIFIKYNTVYLLLFFLPILSTLLFGRVYCGWVCPFGAVSEWLFVKKWAVRIPKKWDRFLKWTRWGILVFLVGRILLGAHVADDWTPFKNLFTFGGSLTNWILTGVFLGLSIISYRPFCKYLCPYGAIMSLVSRFSFRKVALDDSCVRCGQCEKQCGMQALEIPGDPDGDCILCGECASSCRRSSIAVSPKSQQKCSQTKEILKEEKI